MVNLGGAKGIKNTMALIVAKSYTGTYPSTAETYAKIAPGFLEDQDEEDSRKHQLLYFYLYGF